VTTFDPLFPNQGFFSALPVIFPTNLYDLHPLLRLEHGPVSVEASWIFYWRQTVADCGVRCRPVRRWSQRRHLLPVSRVPVFTRVRLSRDTNLSVDAEYSHIFAGPAFRDAGGRDIDYFGTWTTFTY